MRFSFFIIIFCIVCAFIAHSQNEGDCNINNTIVPSSYFAPCNTYEHGDWVLVFEDDFDEESINTSKWFTCPDGWQRHHGDELQYYLDENIVISDGLLRLTAKREPGYYDYYFFDDAGNEQNRQEYYEYTSGWIQTKANFQYGLFEIRCRVPEGKGFWPAFWLYGNGREIDIFEFRGDKPHRPQTDFHVWCDNGVHVHFPKWPYLPNDFSDDFHVFSLEWDQFKIIFRIDNSIIREEYRYMSLPGSYLIDCQHISSELYIEDKTFPNYAQHIILNLALSQEAGGIQDAHAPDSTTVFPSSFDVDYIRIYKKNNPNVTRHLCQIDLKAETSVTTADTIKFGGCYAMDSAIKHNQTSINIANEAIILKDGFYTAPGSVFMAKINHDITRSMVANNNINDLDKTEDWNEKKNAITSTSAIVYPNPNNGSFTINLPFDDNERYVVEIINTEGKRVFFKDDILSNDTYLNSNLNQGIYILKASSNNHSFVNKIVIN